MYLNCFLLIGDVILELLGPGPKQLGHYELKSKDYPGSTMLAGECGQVWADPVFWFWLFLYPFRNWILKQDFMPNFSQIGEMEWPMKVQKLQTITPKRDLFDDELYCLKLLFHTFSGLLRQRSCSFPFVAIYFFFLIPSIPCSLHYPLKPSKAPSLTWLMLSILARCLCILQRRLFHK